jgi:hypothetical protein
VEELGSHCQCNRIRFNRRFAVAPETFHLKCVLTGFQNVELIEVKRVRECLSGFYGAQPATANYY